MNMTHIKAIKINTFVLLYKVITAVLFMFLFPDDLNAF